ncbi:hypothetical protein UlMin_025987 [Ulmus minor]
MEVNAANPHSNGKRSLEHTKSSSQGKKDAEQEIKASAFVNYAAIAWHENRRKWVGDQSQRVKPPARDPIISWSSSYEDLLSTNEPFSEPIPLTEMVDFLVDIWYDDGLFD